MSTGRDLPNDALQSEGRRAVGRAGPCGEARTGCLDCAAEAEALKMLIHLVGDMPPDARRAPFRSGRQPHSVLFFRSRTNLHAVGHGARRGDPASGSYTEWRQQIDRAAHDEVAAMQAGEPGDWIAETQAICTQIYADTPGRTKISYDYVARGDARYRTAVPARRPAAREVAQPDFTGNSDRATDAARPGGSHEKGTLL